MPTDRDIERGRTRKSRSQPRQPTIVYGDARDAVEDTPTSRLAMGITRGKWTGRGLLNAPRRERIERPHRPFPPDPPREPLPPPKGVWVIRAERALAKRRAQWDEKVKPASVTAHQWECRRLLEVEYLTQVAAAELLGIAQKNLRKNAIKAGWVKKSRG